MKFKPGDICLTYPELNWFIGVSDIVTISSYSGDLRYPYKIEECPDSIINKFGEPFFIKKINHYFTKLGRILYK